MKYIVRINNPKFTMTVKYEGVDEEQALRYAKSLLGENAGGIEARVTESRFFGIVERYVTTVR